MRILLLEQFFDPEPTFSCGIVCPPQDMRALADAARRLYAMPAPERAAMGARGREFYQRKLSMDVGVRRFEAVFDGVTRR